MTNTLSQVNGERSPAEVFKDFRKAVVDILKSMDNEEAVLNGVSGIGRGANDIPGQIVSVETAESARNRAKTMSMNGEYKAPEQYPPVIFVVGGPGSNKAELCEDVLKKNSSWGHIR